jgi:hypothetical protein
MTGIVPLKKVSVHALPKPGIELQGIVYVKKSSDNY